MTTQAPFWRVEIFSSWSARMLPHKLAPNCEQLKKKTLVFREKKLCGHGPLTVSKAKNELPLSGSRFEKDGGTAVSVSVRWFGYAQRSALKSCVLVTDNNNYSHRSSTTFKSFFYIQYVLLLLKINVCKWGDLGQRQWRQRKSILMEGLLSTAV